jgi:hypothetical protein
LRPALFFVLFAVSCSVEPRPPAPSLGESDSGTDGGAGDSDRRDDVEASDSGATERDADPDGGQGESSTCDTGPREVDASREVGTPPYTTTFTNFNAKGGQVTRFDTNGNAVDAHDGEIAFFDGLYYLFGTSYGCGYEWNVAGSPFCGFKSYSSPDLANWTDRGFLFDATTASWQARCNGSTYGCYRPHVVHNRSTGLYVLWINVYDNRVGFRVFTSSAPVGPFTETAEPTLAVNNAAPVGGLNNGDHDTFVDDDGTAYLAYTDWRTGGRIAIEKLDASYTSGTGDRALAVTPGSTEAPAVFKRNGVYYLTYSDPNCGYCGGTGTSFRTAPSPLGPWSAGRKISTDSCGGQPSFVAPVAVATGTAFLYGSDLWNKSAKNEALGNYYFAPLGFAPDGSLDALVCQSAVTLDLSVGAPGAPPPPSDLDNTSGAEGFTSFCDIAGAVQRSQTFVAKRNGSLFRASFSTFKSGALNAALELDVYAASASNLPTGVPLFSVTVPASSIAWNPRDLVFEPKIEVKAGERYAIVAKSASTMGCYGLEFNDAAPYPGGGAAYSSTSGATFTAEANRTLRFQTFVQ